MASLLPTMICAPGKKPFSSALFIIESMKTSFFVVSKEAFEFFTELQLIPIRTKNRSTIPIVNFFILFQNYGLILKSWAATSGSLLVPVIIILTAFTGCFG